MQPLDEGCCLLLTFSRLIPPRNRTDTARELNFPGKSLDLNKIIIGNKSDYLTQNHLEKNSSVYTLDAKLFNRSSPLLFESALSRLKHRPSQD